MNQFISFEFSGHAGLPHAHQMTEISKQIMQMMAERAQSMMALEWWAGALEILSLLFIVLI